MTDDRDPMRWLDPDSSVDPLLREVLQRTSSSAPSAAQLQALALKVSAATAVPATAASAAPSALGEAGFAKGGLAKAGLAKAGLAKLSAALLIAGSAGWWAWSSLPANAPAAGPKRAVGSETVSPAPARVESQVLPSAGAQPSAAREIAAPGSESGAAAVPAAPANGTRALPAAELRGARGDKPPAVRAPGAPARRSRSAVAGLRSSPSPRGPVRSGEASGALPSSSAEPGSTPADPPAATEAAGKAPPAPVAADSELTLLSRAQGLLARDPQAALEVMNEHARAYPRGEFAQEREALAIDALRRLGRRQELQTRARAFLQRYPASPHRDRIEGWLR